MVGKRLGMLVGGAICAAAISACGAGEHATYSDNLGPGYVQVGQLYYQVQISRELNPWSDEDKYYLQGFSSSQLQLPPADEWFGVSLQVFNWTHRPYTPTGDFFITDTLGDRYSPLSNGAPNPYSYLPSLIPAGGQLPAIDSDAYTGWSQGEWLIFKIPYTSLVNRPFILHLVNPADTAKQSRIELDV
jgi:hypothetical protein